MGTTSRTDKKPLTFEDMRIANTVLKFAKRDFDRSEVQEDFKRWKEEQTAKKAKEGNR